jgi:hypothetical protein
MSPWAKTHPYWLRAAPVDEGGVYENILFKLF